MDYIWKKKLFIAFFWILFVSNTTVLTNKSSKSSEIVKDVYIAEFHDHFTRRFQSDQFDIFYRQIASTKTIARPRINLTSTFFNGTSFHLPNSQSPERIRALDSVIHLWPVIRYQLPDEFKDATFNQNTGILFDNSTYSTKPLPSDIMTGVDRLHQMGYYGEGVKIAIIDTGVDYLHPDLGGGFGPGYKFSFGYDLVGNDYDGTNNPQPDDDPYDECEYHGTHVSGTIGAQGHLFTGVVPNATLGMYRVFSCSSGPTNDILIQAYTMAQQAGVDIITASIGSASGWQDDAWSSVVNRIAMSGIHCLVAAGNDGSLGPFYGSAAAGAPAAIGVASVNSIAIPLLTMEAVYNTENGSNNFIYKIPLKRQIVPLPNASLTIADSESVNNTDACSALSVSNQSSSNCILLIKFGQCDWNTQSSYLMATGVNYIILYGVANFSFIIDDSSFMYSIVDESLAQIWLTQLKQGENISIETNMNIPIDIDYVEDTQSGGRISDFSSWYPMNDLSFKPDVAGPGGSILSTLPLRMGGYGVLSGTSMATPYMAGITALYLSVRGFTENITTEGLKNIILSTATPVNYSYLMIDYSYLAPTAKQGLGLVNALAALQWTTQISISAISLNDTDNMQNTTTFTIFNCGNETVTYTISHIGAATFYGLSLQSSGIYDIGDISSLLETYATVNLSESSISLPGGSYTVITAEFAPPVDVELDLLPIYSGYIQINGSNGEIRRFGYMGAACSMKDLNLTNTWISYTSFGLKYNDSQLSLEIYDGFMVDFTQMTLSVTGRLLLGTRLLSIDILEADGNNTADGISIFDTIPGFPAINLPRLKSITLFFQGWNGTLCSNEMLPPGNYSLVSRALKIFGDIEQADDFYACYSPTFIVV